MKVLTTFFAAASLLTLMPASPAMADTPDSADLGIVNFCKYDVPTNHPDEHVGNCVSFQSTNFRDNVNGLIPHLCFYIQDAHPDLFYSAYDSYEDCILDRASAFLG